MGEPRASWGESPRYGRAKETEPEGRARGSLSGLIVAFENWETTPREPVISEADRRGDGLV